MTWVLLLGLRCMTSDSYPRISTKLVNNNCFLNKNTSINLIAFLFTLGRVITLGSPAWVTIAFSFFVPPQAAIAQTPPPDPSQSSTVGQSVTNPATSTTTLVISKPLTTSPPRPCFQQERSVHKSLLSTNPVLMA